MDHGSRVRSLSAAFFAAAVLACGAASADGRRHGPPRPIPCDALASLALPETLSLTAQLVTGGTFDPPDDSPFGPTPPLTNLPDFCRVSIVVAPQINVEVWLPATGWNGRFQGVGGGGYAGNISWGALGNALRAAYATASTDTGHSAIETPGGSFALDDDGTLNWGLIEDFASRSLFELTAKAKTVIRAFYGEQPKYSYWNGCSTGGRQGLMQVQRTADAYDGVLAGAPAINWDRFIPAELWPQIAMRLEVGQPISADKFTLVNNAALAACDALDGVVDGVLEDPRRCRFDPRALQCPAGVPPGPDCLTSGEVSAIRKIWDGARNTRGKRLWYGLEPTTSFGGLAGSIAGTFFPFPIATDHFRFWIHRDPAFDWRTVDYAGFARDFRESRLLFNDVIGTDDPDLHRFRKRGGKVLIWHGWVDQLIFPRGTIDYYERVVHRTGGLERTQKFARLFMAPGVAHCAGGPGPNVFDMFGALVKWVEQNEPPERIVASRIQAGEVVRTRPLCPYPAVAKYKGSGSTDDEANFVCRAPRGHRPHHDD
jgi:hypothetical protein